MSKPLTPELQQAQQIAATAQVLAVISLVIIAIAIVTRLGFPIGAALFDAATPWRTHVYDIGLISISLLPSFLFYEAVNQLRRALKLYSDGEFFSAAAASRVALAGDYALGAMATLMLVVPNVTLWIKERGGFDVRIESEYIGMLAFALFVSAVGRILAAATQLKTENDSFV
jgi:Protein of unknown function (DUF2975)